MFGTGGVFQVAIRKVFRVSVVRVLLLQCMLFASATWGQDGSTGALRGVVLDCAGSSDCECGYRGDPGGDRNEISLGDGFGGEVCCGLAATGGIFGASGGGRDVAAGVSDDSGGSGRGDAGDIQIESGGPAGNNYGVGGSEGGDPNPSSVSGPVEERAIKDLPLNGRRFTDLPLLMPGVTQDPRGQTGGSNGDLSYGGLRGYNTSFLVDGGDNRPPGPPRSAPS
jgi:hypothetical protein